MPFACTCAPGMACSECGGSARTGPRSASNDSSVHPAATGLRPTPNKSIAVDALLSNEAVEVIALRRRNGQPDDGSDCDYAVWLDAQGDLRAVVEYLAGGQHGSR